MISNIEFERFQGLKLNQDVKLAPLTLIFGPNAGGKSSIFRGMRLLKQSWSVHEGVEYSAKDIDLWSFENTVYQHKSDSNFVIGITIPSFENKIIGAGFKFFDVTTRFVIEKFGISSMSLEFRIEHFASRGDELGAIFRMEIVPTAGSSTRTYKITEVNGTNLDRLTDAVQSMRYIADESVDLDSSEDIAEKLTGRTIKFNGFRPVLESQSSSSQNAMRFWSRVIGPVLNGVAQELSQIQHVGPLRTVPGNFYADSKSMQKITSDGSNIDSILISAPTSERTKVSEWLFRLTGGNYKLVKAKFNNSAFGEIAQILLKDVHNDTIVRFSDVGVGLSQILPILAHLLISTPASQAQRGVRRERGGILLIEQPELHLHPIMQAELCDLLIEQAKLAQNGGGKQIIVETHSENLLLRLKKRLREGQISADQVSIIYVNRFPEGGSLAQPIRLGEDGKFRDDMPLDFVDLRAKEIYGD